jgi:hypothetical protein
MDGSERDCDHAARTAAVSPRPVRLVEITEEPAASGCSFPHRRAEGPVVPLERQFPPAPTDDDR